MLVPKHHVDHGQAFEVVADRHFRRHAHAAVKLDALTDQPAALPISALAAEAAFARCPRVSLPSAGTR